MFQEINAILSSDASAEDKLKKIAEIAAIATTESLAPKPARTDSSMLPQTKGFLHGLSDKAHAQVIACMRRYGC